MKTSPTPTASLSVSPDQQSKDRKAINKYFRKLTRNSSEKKEQHHRAPADTSASQDPINDAHPRDDIHRIHLEQQDWKKIKWHVFFSSPIYPIEITSFKDVD